MVQPQPTLRKFVLVVEDEPLLRMLAVAVVEGAGFAVIEAWNADEAVHILERRDDIAIVGAMAVDAAACRSLEFIGLAFVEDDDALVVAKARGGRHRLAARQ